MPLTPFHFGPGIFIKSLSPKKFSLSTFIVSQIVMDSETAWNIYEGNTRLHTFFHTYLGSNVAAAVSTIGVLLSYRLLQYLKRIISPSLATSHSKNRTSYPSEFQTPPLATIIMSSLIGTWSHVLLDSFMHSDMAPFAPFSEANPLLGLVSLNALYMGCVMSGFIGGMIWAIEIRRFKNRH